MQKFLGGLMILSAVIGMTLALSPPKGSSGNPAPEYLTAAAQPSPDLIAVKPPPFSEDIFPCSECHRPEDEINRIPHAVPDHENVVFKHDAENRWCLDCHDSRDRDMLHLADGRLIPFDESFRLCGQCHGPELRDWKTGIHGKRTGSWSGKKEYLLCVHCHNAHSPAIQAIQPKPAPERPENLR
jgi:hypothetical protein